MPPLLTPFPGSRASTCSRNKEIYERDSSRTTWLEWERVIGGMISAFVEKQSLEDVFIINQGKEFRKRIVLGKREEKLVLFKTMLTT